jgi:hypothetical protein
VNRFLKPILTLSVAGAVLLAAAAPAGAQVKSSTGSGLSSSGSGLSSSGSGLGSSGLGSSSLGSSSSGLSSMGLGSTGLSSTGLSGSTTGSTSGTGRTGGTAAIGSTSFLGANYANPMAAGLPSGMAQPAFGNPLIKVSNTNTGRTTTTGTISTSNNNNFGLGVGVRRAPQYVSALHGDVSVRPVVPSRLQTDIQQTIARSSRLTLPGQVRVVMDGATVVLQGSVANPRERQLAESLVRLTPGVRLVRNELSMRNPTP